MKQLVHVFLLCAVSCSNVDPPQPSETQIDAEDRLPQGSIVEEEMMANTLDILVNNSRLRRYSFAVREELHAFAGDGLLHPTSGDGLLQSESKTYTLGPREQVALGERWYTYGERRVGFYVREIVGIEVP